MNPVERTAAVDLDGLMRVLGENLYSSPHVAVRELVQNAHDSITRRRRDGERFDGRITVSVDEHDRTLTITDNGIGLTRSQIIEFLATIGAGQTRLVRTESADAGLGDTGLIGQFGLGFLSAFVIADEVEVETTAVSTPGERWLYRSSTGVTFALSDLSSAEHRPVGSIVRLHIAPDHGALLDVVHVQSVLERHCSFLAEPIELITDSGPLGINVAPPWRGHDDDRFEPHERRARALAFASRFEPTEPLCTIEVVPFGNSDARGLLWVQGSATYGSSDNRNLAVYLRGMLLDDDARDLLPRWAGFVGGVIESTSLVPTASREDLQRTPAYDAVQAAISESLVLGLASVARTQPAAWRRIVNRHNEALLGAAIVDERLFDVIASAVNVPTTQGDLAADSLVRDGRIHLGSEFAGGFAETIFRALRVPVARADRYGVSPFVRRWAESRRVRLVEIGTQEGNEAIFVDAELPPDDVAFLQRTLASPDEVVKVARFEPSELALASVVDRDVELKRRLDDDDADRRIASMALNLARLYTDRIEDRPERTLYVNVGCPAITALIAAHVMGNEHIDAAASLLRSTKVLLGSSAQGDGLREALASVNTAVDHLLEHR